MPFERALVINLNQIGAVMLAMPVFKALKDANPRAYVATLVRDSMRPLLQGNPYVDEVIGWDMSWPLSRRRQVIRQMRKGQFDTALDLSHSMERAILTWLSGARTRVGFNTSELPFLHNVRVKEKTGAYHSTERNLDQVRALGIEAHGEEGFRLYLSDEERRWAAEWLQSEGIGADEVLIGLNPGASNPMNHWFPASFARLAELLTAKGYRVAILGGPMDVAESEEIAGLTEAPVLQWAGRFDYRQLAAILARINVLVTPDTGPMHMAVGLRTPLVALFGPADPRWTGPYCGPRVIIQREELDCIRCIQKSCPRERICFQLITPEEVMGSVEALLARE